MSKPVKNLLTGILIFTIGFISALFSQIYPDVKILIRITFIMSIIYLSLGWYIFRSYIPEGHPLLLFIMGYLYAGVFMASVFAATGWPLSQTIASTAPIWVIGQTILIVVLRKKMTQEVFMQFLIETGLLLILSISLLI